MKYFEGAVVVHNGAFFVWSPLAWGWGPPCYLDRCALTGAIEQLAPAIPIPIGIDGLEFA